jgi:8-oxo-dGTP pyrophosphatase MutT (NUDIX family)
MPLDQTAPDFLNTLRNLAQGFLDWSSQEAQEGHHPPSPQQHQQALAAPQQTQDVNEPPEYPKQAAGMLLMAPDGRALFLRRNGSADHGGEWAFPGGMAKPGELPRDNAFRETCEEIGDCGIDRNRMELLDHSISGDLGFTTFGGRVADAFQPRMNHEHNAFRWATPDQAPQPLHPGVRATLDFAQDPLTEKGSKILSSMREHYGPEKGEQVFYASANKGNITGVHQDAIPVVNRQNNTIRAQPQPNNPFSANLDQAQPQRDPAGRFSAGGTTSPTAKRIAQIHRSEHVPRTGFLRHFTANDPDKFNAVEFHENLAKHAERQGRPERAAMHRETGKRWAKSTQRAVGPDAAPGWSSPRWDAAPTDIATDPPVSEAQRKAMHAAASGKSNIGIPKSVGQEFAEADPGGKLPSRAKDAEIAIVPPARPRATIPHPRINRLPIGTQDQPPAPSPRQLLVNQPQPRTTTPHPRIPNTPLGTQDQPPQPPPSRARGGNAPVPPPPNSPAAQATRLVQQQQGKPAGQDNMGQRFKLYDTATGSWHDLNEDAQGPAQTALAQPDQRQQEPIQQGASQGPARPMTPIQQKGMATRMYGPGAKVSGGRTVNPMMMGAAPKQPRYTESRKMDFGDGTVDEHKLTRPFGPPPQGHPAYGGPGSWDAAGAAPGSPQTTTGWSSPRWDQGTGGGGWPTSGNLGPSAKGTDQGNRF